MILAIDIGGTHLRYEIKEQNKTIKKATLNSKKYALCNFIESMLQEYKNINLVAISFAGQVRDGKIISAPNIKVDRKDIKQYIEGKYSIELLIENDLNCAVIAENEIYKSKNISTVYIGTGLGLGVIANDTLIKGATNIATELGHIPYKKTPFKCGCGKDNCIELICSGSALKRWVEYYNLNLNPTLNELKNANCSEAKTIYEEFFEALYSAVGIVITLFNPEILILGGGVVVHNNEIIKKLKEHIKNYAFPLALKDIKIIKTTLTDAPLKGAFLLKNI